MLAWRLRLGWRFKVWDLELRRYPLDNACLAIPLHHVRDLVRIPALRHERQSAGKREREKEIKRERERKRKIKREREKGKECQTHLVVIPTLRHSAPAGKRERVRRIKSERKREQNRDSD
jgi:hypothetical protein